MPVESFSIPEIMKDEISALIKAGIYSSRSDIAREAFRCLLEHNPELRVNAAVEMYNEGKISLGRAAEVAGLDFEAFKEALKERGTKIILAAGKASLKKGEKIIKGARK